MIECPDCEGAGVVWDGSECGDPDHCGPADCVTCGGSGVIDGEPAADG